ncbi:MAG TPA: sigma-70 family RNA polymerase sigma factor [Saprospiraceae bacterium]|nr:sigma-70 family RNA polymerase sigma factor [Saprospiraceae bacterium]
MDQLKTSPSRVDDEFIHAIRAGGAIADKAIMSVYMRYNRTIHVFVHLLMSRTTKHNREPDDVVHDSFIIMLDKIQHTSSVVVSIPAFWSGIAKNLILNQIKRNKKFEYVGEPQESYGLEENNPESIVLHNERFEQLDKCFSNCGSRCHEILLLWFSDYTMQEIAEKLKLSGPAMARKIKHKCFQKLKDLIIKGNILES